MISINRIIITLLVFGTVFCQEQKPLRPVSTYSIVAVDQETGQMGVAVQSHWFSVGSLVTWAEPGTGVVATQSFVRPEYGPELLHLMSRGYSAKTAINKLTAQDTERNVRQIGVVRIDGQSASYTGEDCVGFASGLEGKGYAIQANIMANPGVPEAMELAYLKTKGPLAGRLYAALIAAEEAGGDLRGRQSAALLVVPKEKVDNLLSSKIYDIRVDDHPDPLGELGRLMQVQKAYIYANDGDILSAQGKLDEALDAYNKASELYPENVELLFWGAVILCAEGKFDIAKPMLEQVFSGNPDLKQMIPRLQNHPMFPLSQDVVNQIMAL